MNSHPHHYKSTDRRERSRQATDAAGALSLEIFQRVYVSCGSWPCENSSALRARRSISEKLHIMELNHPAQIQLDTVSENHRGQSERPHSSNGGDHRGIGVLLVVPRDHIWIGEPSRYIERKLFLRPGKKFRRSERAIVVCGGLNSRSSTGLVVGPPNRDRRSRWFALNALRA